MYELTEFEQALKSVNISAYNLTTKNGTEVNVDTLISAHNLLNKTDYIRVKTILEIREEQSK